MAAWWSGLKTCNGRHARPGAGLHEPDISAQPAATDPQTVAALQDKLKTLTKENDLLKVALAKANNKPSTAPASGRRSEP